jgi:maleate cis-trans isomerase
MSYVKKTHRFGLLTPSSNTTQEPELSAALPPDVSLHTGRVTYRDITPEEQMRCVLELEQESRKLADAEVDVIVFAATAPSLAKGKGYDRELIKRMEDASGKPATTASTAFVEALACLGIRRIAIAAPWSEAMNKTVVSFMEANGFEVVNCGVMGLVQNTELGRADPETAYELGRRVDRPDADAVILPGGNWPTMSIVERLERDIGKPVLTNNAVSIWAGLRILRCHDSIAGYGRLLRDHMGRETETMSAKASPESKQNRLG